MCERHYTQAVISELQAIALAVELRNRLQTLSDDERRAYIAGCFLPRVWKELANVTPNHATGARFWCTSQ